MKIQNLLLPICFMLLFFIGCKEDKKTSLDKEAVEEDIDWNNKTQSARTKIYSPEEQLAGFSVPEGFVVELVASEKDGIVNPIDITFDDAGRLWTQTAEMYPLDPVADIKWQELLRLMDNPEEQRKNPDFKRIFDLYEGKTKGKDKILVLSNFYNNDKVKSNVWAEGLALPQSILPYKDGVYVAQGSELFFLNDTNNDGKSDVRTPLFSGFGITDTHTMAHLMVRSPGDWVHFSHGALNKGLVTSTTSDVKTAIDFSKIVRFSLDAKKMNVVSSGLNNIWGFQLRGNGQWFGTEANDLGLSIVPMEPGTGYKGIGNERIRPYQPWMPELHKFRVGGTGISGLAFADDVAGSFPEEWKDVAFLANAITSKINAVKIVRNQDGSVTAKHLPDFLTSKDDWFRPVNMEFGPDGCLYIADWYNKIVSHNELPTTHPDRDKSHGRIWRVRHKSQKKREIPNLSKLGTDKLVASLSAPSLWEKRAAWHQITDRPISETKGLSSELVALVSDDSKDEITRILGLWSLEGIHFYNAQLMADLLQSPLPNLRREAVRSLNSFELSAVEMAQALSILLSDKDVMVRSQVLRTLTDFNDVNPAIISMLVQACKPSLEGNKMGGAYERNFERYLARKALEKYPNKVLTLIHSKEATKLPTSNLIWASQVVEGKERESVFLELWQKETNKELDEATFIIVAGMLANTSIYKTVLPLFTNAANAEKYVNFAVNNQQAVQSKEMSVILSKAVNSLLKSDTYANQILGLKAAGKLKINNTTKATVSLIKEGASDEVMSLVINVLELDIKSNKGYFEKIANNKKLALAIRVAAVHDLAKSTPTKAISILNDWIPTLDEVGLKLITKLLSGSKEGANVLKSLFKKEILTAGSFSISSAEKIAKSDDKDVVGSTLLNLVRQTLEADKAAFAAKLQKFMAIAEKENGNAEKGKQLFQTCLMCHKVGAEGQEIAPALDGSALRENEALLTAILDPDAALESGYAVYRITKKDGSTVEGYLVKKDEKGATVAFMGGSTVFVAVNDIQEQGFLGGRSFMVKGLIDFYSDEQVADLLAYIKTLK